MNINDDIIQNTFQVTKRTVRYWRSNGFPQYAVERISLMTGDHPDWRGFKIREGFIWTPAGDKVTKSEIDLYRWLFTESRRESLRCNSLEKQVRDLQYQLSELSNFTLFYRPIVNFSDNCAASVVRPSAPAAVPAAPCLAFNYCG